MSNIIRNALQTPDGTVLESHSRHDFKTHVDDITGLIYAVDGGLDYVHRTCNGDEIDLTVTLDDPHEVVREAMTWGTYGKDGDEPFHHITLKDMTLGHICACLETATNMYPQYRIAMKNELEYRHLEFQKGSQNE